MERRMLIASLPQEELVILNYLMMVKYLNDNLDPAMIRAKLEGTRKYLP